MSSFDLKMSWPCHSLSKWVNFFIRVGPSTTLPQCSQLGAFYTSVSQIHVHKLKPSYITFETIKMTNRRVSDPFYLECAEINDLL